MPAMSRGREQRPSKVTKPSRTPKPKKGGTPSSRKHHFESFSQRIAKLNIDPVRRARRSVFDEHSLSTTTSYLKTSFEEWKDLNLSENFTNFSREVAPLCESLPQIIHYDDQIMDLLVAYIGKEDYFSLEPLLNMVAHFAHDLGARFEKHFARAVQTICRIAAKHPDVEVIEWSFTCLAWLFKYLSKLLVSDLRPLFDLMAPLLGKEHQKPFITRFAAESLSFLLRKAGAAYHRDQAPLQMIVEHVFRDLEEAANDKDVNQYEQGLMCLFVEAIKGVQGGLHSSGHAVFKEMVLIALSSRKSESLIEQRPATDVVQGVLTSIIHHSSAETFKPILEAVIECTSLSDPKPTPQQIEDSARLIFVVAGVRKGTRIGAWEPLMANTGRLVQVATENRHVVNSQIAVDVMSTLAVVLQTCPLDVVIPHLRVLDTISTGAWQDQFLSFCSIFAELGAERFQSLVLPHFKKFIVSRWKQDSEGLAATIPKLAGQGCFGTTSLVCPPAWQAEILSSFKSLSGTKTRTPEAENEAVRCNAYLDILRVASTDQHIETEIQSELRKLLVQSLDIQSTGDISPQELFAVGGGFKYVVDSNTNKTKDLELWPAICQASKNFTNYPVFWDSASKYLRSRKDELEVEGYRTELLVDAAVDCLGSPSHELRSSSLDVLEILFRLTHGDEESECLSTAILIESMPLNIETARAVSMHIRRLATSYKKVSGDPMISRAIPTFLFGLLHVRFTQVWEDSCNALKEICETKEGEQFASELAFSWLEKATKDDETPSDDSAAESHVESASQFAGTEFECSNLNHLASLSKQVAGQLSNVRGHLDNKFAQSHGRVDFITSSSRSQALRVLNAIPQVAEKRSRLLVPNLLHWAIGAEERPSDNSADNEAESAGVVPHGWSRKDQKAMLSVFAKFNNPKVLYRSADVYSALLALLANGDVEIQKSALKAVFTWKNRSINKYEENLTNLLDDARFREQISVFLGVGNDDESLQDEDREDIMPVVLRMLYGKIVNRSGSSSGGGQGTKRKAVFQALTRFGDDVFHRFLGIVLGPLADMTLVEDSQLREDKLSEEILSIRKQFGLLNMLEDLLDTLGTQAVPFTAELVDPILYCLIRASRAISSAGTNEQGGHSGNAQSLLSSIRQVGFHCLIKLFDVCPEHSWETYIPSLLEELVVPRLDKLAIETAQSVSGILKLFSAWSKSTHTASFLVKYRENLLDRVAGCLEVSFAKEEVKLFILKDIIQELVNLAGASSSDGEELPEADQTFVREQILQPKAGLLLQRIGAELQKSPSKELLEAGVSTVSRLAPFATGTEESTTMIKISVFLLQQPTKRVTFRTKSDLLTILHSFIPRCAFESGDETLHQVFDIACSLFGNFQDQTGRPNRSLLCHILEDLANTDEELRQVVAWCWDINSFAPGRLDEPDFDRRAKAFHAINEDHYMSLSLKQWQPLVYNMLFYIKEQEELVIRVNASYALRRFVEAASQKEDTERELFQKLISVGVLPGIHSGVREKSELVRMEYMSVLAHIVRHFDTWDAVSDMHVLLVGGDEEASVFSNILHIQQHRRMKALRRLAAESSKLASGNISHIFVPLIEHFIFDKADDFGGHNLASDATNTVGALALGMEWPQYRSLLGRYAKLELDKPAIRLLGVMINSLSAAAGAKGLCKQPAAVTEPNKLVDDDADEPMVGDSPAEDKPTKLSRTMPSQEKLSANLTNGLLPGLESYLHQKDESTVSLRVPVAIIVVKLIQVLPVEEFKARLTPVLMDVSHILRSRSQDSRDMTRKTLAEISALIGSEYFGFMLKALRSALQRGYQLHVLSFTVHSILVSMTPTFKPGDLDYCLNEIVAVVMDDIFGVTGQEKDAEEYISKMREVKSSKSFDSMELLAKTTTVRKFAALVRPVQSLLLEKLDIKMAKKIDELLRRTGLGILHNEAAQSREVLVFCYQLIQEVYKAKEEHSRNKDEEEDPRKKRYLINMKQASKNLNKGAMTSQIHKMIRFSLDILRAILHKHEALKTPANLKGFMPMIGDAVVSGQEEIQMSAIRLLSSIIKVPLAEIDRDARVYVAEAVRIIKAERDTNTELAQASLKLISAVLRERRNTEVRETDVAYILKRVKNDLEEPDRQGVTFNFLKAVLGRKITITEVYDILDTVAATMVTNQTRSARDLSRGVYFQFLMDFPQGEVRLSKQLAFLIKNLDYKYKEGRQSLMEALHLLLTKVPDELVQDIANDAFAPLVLRLVNDEDKDCREMAAALLKKVFGRADGERTKKFVSIMKTWLEQDEQVLKRRLAIQCWTLYLEVTEGQAKEATYVLKQLPEVIDGAIEGQEENDWELLYYSLQAFSKLCKLSPASTFATSAQPLWTATRTCLTYPHAWVKLSAARLIGLYFADFASHNAADGFSSLPLSGSGGLTLTGDDMLDLTYASLRILRVPGVSEELATQAVRNLVFLGRCFAANELRWKPRNANEESALREAEVEDADDAAASGDEEAQATAEAGTKSALQYLFERLSVILRREPATTRAAALHPKTASLALFASLCNALPLEALRPSAPTILLPLNNLTDPNISHPSSIDDAFNEAYKSLVGTAQEVMALLQKKMGTTEYVAVLQGVREKVKERREGRRVKRRIDAIKEPEKAERVKRRKHENSKLKKKEKGQEARGRRRGW